MMISPQTYRLEHARHSLVHLKLERTRLEREIDRLQKEIDSGILHAVIKTPSRRTKLSVYKEYLKEIDDLISRREKLRFWKRWKKNNKISD